MDISSESLNFSNASNTKKQMIYLYPKMASRLEQYLRLKTLGYLLFIPANFFYLLFGCPMANFRLLLNIQYHSPNVNHCIWAISFWPRAGIGGVGSLHHWVPSELWSHCHNTPNSKLHKILSPGLNPVFPKCGNAPNTQNRYSLTLWWPLACKIPPWMQNLGFKTLAFCW